MLAGTGLAACVVVLRQRKAAERQGKVLIIDASGLFRRGRNQNTLEAEHRERIEQVYASFADEQGFAHVADLDEIAGSGHSAQTTEPPQLQGFSEWS
jgi:type I restriction enzyme M protein